MPSGTVRYLVRATAGASQVEYIVVAGVVALAAVGAYRAFGGSLARKAQAERDKVATLTPMTSGEGAGGNTPSVPGAALPPGRATCTGGTCQGGSSCFVAGTPVATPSGLTPIEQIHAGDEVLTFREATAELLVGRVSATFATPHRDLMDIHLHGDASPLRATPGHRFFTLDRGWIGAEELVEGEPLVDVHGSAVVVDRIAIDPSRDTVYNFEVEDTHTYFVGAEGVLVHNPVQVPVVDLGSDTGPEAVYQPRLNNPSTAALIYLSEDSELRPLVVDFANGHPGIPLLDYQDLRRPHALTGVTDIVVIAHGSPGQIRWGYGSISGQELANRLAQAGYDPSAVAANAEAFIIACNAGTCAWNSSVAQAVADRFRIHAYGPNGVAVTGIDQDDPSTPPFVVVENGGQLVRCQPQQVAPAPPRPTGPTFESMGFSSAPPPPSR